MAKIVQRPISIDLYNFLSTMKVDSDSTVVNQGNVIDNSDTYISKMYTPNLKVSNATKTFLDNIGVTCIIDTNLDLDEDSITYWLLNSDLKDKDLKLYNLFKSVIADMYSYTYAIDDNPDYLKFIDKKDFIRTINNITYIIDYLSSSIENSNIISQLYDITAALGVLKNQLSTIKNGGSDGEI